MGDLLECDAPGPACRKEATYGHKYRAARARPGICIVLEEDGDDIPSGSEGPLGVLPEADHRPDEGRPTRVRRGARRSRQERDQGAHGDMRRALSLPEDPGAAGPRVLQQAAEGLFGAADRPER